MQFFQQYWKRSVVTTGSLLFSFSIAPSVYAATHSSVEQSKPGIFSEFPFNTRRLDRPFSPAIVPPLPEQLQPPSAIVTPVDGAINVQLTNPTNAAISFEVIGHTEPRTLAPRSSLTLKDLPAPVSVSFRRQDGGLLDIQAQTEATPGVLQITFDEVEDLNKDRIALKVQADGSVFLN
ncbi:hypothetical protein LEP3755_21580 [Leptolyngbya sp. NIES-3755]|nr:hypothetical protein LEP3755_21580 [Leptolyngbya sp. NIES-3755]